MNHVLAVHNHFLVVEASDHLCVLANFDPLSFVRVERGSEADVEEAWGTGRIRHG